jgi:hypothetical protein
MGRSWGLTFPPVQRATNDLLARSAPVRRAHVLAVLRSSAFPHSAPPPGLSLPRQPAKESGTLSDISVAPSALSPVSSPPSLTTWRRPSRVHRIVLGHRTCLPHL